jgi:predicted HAD superfamily Cof-like phosphohydrolase
MKKQLAAVAEFHKAFGQEDGTFPRPLTNKEVLLRYDLMAEENDEYLEACADNSLIEIADALGDQLYILCGTILRHGMQHVIEEVFDEIQASNMSKLGEDGKPIYREDGKILKGPSYFRPDLSKFIKAD